MNSDADNASPKVTVDPVAAATSELNNVLQIISNTSSLVARDCEGRPESEEHLATLRDSIDRAGKVAAGLVKQAGGPEEKALINPDLTSLDERKDAPTLKKRKPWILVVDDEQVTLGLLGRILTEAGYDVSAAQSGFECLEHFRPRPYQFDLVILDLTMPFMDGEETFHRLREIRPNIPIVLCTGFIQQERLQGLLARGLAGFLRKPVAPDEIIGHIRRILASVRYSRDTVDPSTAPAVV
jgi:CheY-like chemotaxis protein